MSTGLLVTLGVGGLVLVCTAVCVYLRLVDRLALLALETRALRRSLGIAGDTIDRLRDDVERLKRAYGISSE